MNHFRKSVVRLIGFTRGEKRATLVIALILLAVIIIRYSLVSKAPEAIVITPLTARETSSEVISGAISRPERFPFDPNTATREMLLDLGLNERQASTLINYRIAGAKFFKASDLLKVYGMDSLLVSTLEPYVIINNTVVEKGNPNKETYDVNNDHNNCVRASSLTELNSCTAVELQSLPGIGSVLSERIIKYRSLLGGFVTPVQLKEVYGIDTANLKMIYSLVYVNPDSVRQIRVDSCGFKELARHPYIGSATAKAILKYIDLIGLPASMEELIRERVVDSVTAHRMAPYLNFKKSASEETNSE